MDLRCRSYFSTKGLTCSRKDRDVRCSYGFEHAEGIGCNIVNGSIAIDCTDTEDAKRWVVDGKQYSTGVLDESVPFQGIVELAHIMSFMR